MNCSVIMSLSNSHRIKMHTDLEISLRMSWQNKIWSAIWPDRALNRGISFVHILRLFLFWFQLHFSATVRNIYRRPTPAVFTRPANRATTLCHRGLGFKAIFPCKRWFAVRSAPGRAADWDARSYRQPKLMLIWKPTPSETSAIFVTLPSTMF